MHHINLEGFTARPVIRCDNEMVWFATSGRIEDQSHKGLPIDNFYHSFVDGFGMLRYNEWDQCAFVDALGSLNFESAVETQ